MSLAQLLAAMDQDDRGDSRQNSRPPALAAEMLVEHAQRYAEFMKGCPFKAGELVTPRKDGDVRGAGDPHIVLEVRSTPEPHFTDDPSSNDSGKRMDMRVSSFVGSKIIPHWVESLQFEPYSAPAAA